MVKILALWLFLQVPILEHDSIPTDREIELTEHMNEFLDTINKTRQYKRRLAEAKAIVPLILKHCKKYGVDVLQAGVIAQYEGQWEENVLGKLGEVGPMQVMPKYFKQFDLTTLDGKVEAGIYHLRVSMDACGGSVARMYQYYGSNRCGPVKGFARFRAWQFDRAVRKHRKRARRGMMREK